jgi:hypothetical protein
MGMIHPCLKNDLVDSNSNEYKFESDAELANKITKLAGHINPSSLLYV